MGKQIIIPFDSLVVLRDALGAAKSSSVNAAFVCGQLHSALTNTIKRLEKEAEQNEKAV